MVVCVAGCRFCPDIVGKTPNEPASTHGRLLTSFIADNYFVLTELERSVVTDVEGLHVARTNVARQMIPNATAISFMCGLQTTS